jgi:hypothetical protein
MALEFSDWIDSAYQHRLKIYDIMNLKHGDRVELLL